MWYRSSFRQEVRPISRPSTRQGYLVSPDPRLTNLYCNTGAGMLVKASTAEKGGNVIKVGLIIQIIFFGLFIITSIIFHVKLVKNGSRVLQQRQVPWKKHQTALYMGSLLIFVRCIFRYIEYNQGNSGTLLQHEFYSYIFDAALMLLVMVAFNVVHPAEISRLMEERKGGYRMGLIG